MVREDTERSGAALLAVTDTTGVTHLVTEDAMTIGRLLLGGRYIGCCGDEILAGSLTTPETAYCRRCRHWRAGETR